MRSSGSTFTWERSTWGQLCPPPLPDPAREPPHPTPTAHPHLALAWAQVEVKAALEALLDEAAVRRHSPQAREPARQEVEPPLVGLSLLPGHAL